MVLRVFVHSAVNTHGSDQLVEKFAWSCFFFFALRWRRAQSGGQRKKSGCGA
jgi:hypothetical protein